jgi:hypothetical protein
MGGWIANASNAVNFLLAQPAIAKGDKGDQGVPGLAGVPGPMGPPGPPTYFAGSGLTLSGTTFSLTLPIPNSELQFSSVTLNGHALSLGGTLSLNLADVATDPLTVAHGGTGLTSGTSGGIPYFSGSTSIASSGALTSGFLVIGGGAGGSPTVDDWQIASHSLQGPGVDSTNLLVNGATKGVRIYATSTNGAIEGVDNTGAINYQPLVVGGSSLNLALSGTTKATLDSTSGFQALGTTTNNNAAAGNIGEYISAQILSASAIALTSNTVTNITSISLTAGDWDVGGNIYFAPTGLLFWAIGSIGTVTATLEDHALSTVLSPQSVSGVEMSGAITTQRLSLASTTTVYLVAEASVNTGTVKGGGLIWARRVR